MEAEDGYSPYLEFDKYNQFSNVECIKCSTAKKAGCQHVQLTSNGVRHAKDHPLCGFHGDFIVMPNGLVPLTRQNQPKGGCKCKSYQLKQSASFWLNAGSDKNSSQVVANVVHQKPIYMITGFLGRIDDKGTILEQLQKNHFIPELFEDYSQAMRQIWGQMIFDYGPGTLYSNIGADRKRLCKTKCGYCLIIARKEKICRNIVFVPQLYMLATEKRSLKCRLCAPKCDKFS